MKCLLAQAGRTTDDGASSAISCSSGTLGVGSLQWMCLLCSFPVAVLPTFVAVPTDRRSYTSLYRSGQYRRATAARAGALGIATELSRISSRRPMAALVELISERRASLVVLGPDARRTPRWQLRLAARRVRRQTDCLMWIAPD